MSLSGRSYHRSDTTVVIHIASGLSQKAYKALNHQGTKEALLIAGHSSVECRKTLCLRAFVVPFFSVPFATPSFAGWGCNCYGNFCKVVLLITSSLQSIPSALSLNPDKNEELVCFDGRSISHLPAEMLLGITRYLSMRDVLVLGQVCRDLRSNLERCGVIIDIRNYLPLPQHIKRSIHRLVTGNRLLIDHLRNNSVFCHKTFPIQHTPAIYTKYVRRFREHTIRASSVTLVQSGCINESTHVSFYKLNYQHNCLIRDGIDVDYLQVWTNQKGGLWENENTIDGYKTFLFCRQHDTDILFVGGKEDGKSHLAILERNESGEWNVIQKQCLNQISTSLKDHIVTQIILAENQRMMMCEVVMPHLWRSERRLLIFAVDDGLWQLKGNCRLRGYEDYLQFSQNCRHVAALSSSGIIFYSRQDDGTWIETGDIYDHDFLLERDKFEFSADNHHLVAWGQKYRGLSCVEPIRISPDGRRMPCRTDPIVLVASLGDQGHWSESQRFSRICDQKMSPHARFSPDGKHLFVCIDNQLNIMSLHEGSPVPSTNLLKPGSSCQIRTTMDPSLFMVTSDTTASIYAIDASGVWGKQHEFSSSPECSAKITADGTTVICRPGKARQIDIWSRRHSDQWIKQEIAIPATQADFSPDGSLVALAEDRDLFILGLTEQGQWREKGRQKLDHPVTSLSFSPCGRSIRIDLGVGNNGCCDVTFWQIVTEK